MKNSQGIIQSMNNRKFKDTLKYQSTHLEEQKAWERKGK
jgi:hypothetical protein